MKKLLFLLLSLSVFNAKSQIVVDNTTPYDNPTWLVENILLGGGVTASNIVFQGEPSQIGWFDAVNTNLGIDSGIVMCTGDIYALDPVNGGGFPVIPNTVTDPDLLAVANSVPGMIGQSFSVSSVNDIAILEFDFIPTSDSLKFRYAFGSQEYFAFENTSYNDVFGFFLSGPGIAGPWANGAVNLAIVPGTNPPLPITISSVNSVTPINQQYFVDNQAGLNIIADADGFTTVLTAEALVQCGATYHIKLAIADGSDGGLSSYVWLESGSFSSPELNVTDNLGIDSTVLDIPCGFEVILTASAGVGATYEWYDSTATLVGIDSSIIVENGSYYVIASDISGCGSVSDTFNVVSPLFKLKDFTVSQTDVSCWDDEDGSISLLIDDYVNVLSYNFYLDGDLNMNPHPLDTFFEGVSAGTHLIKIVDSLFLCDTSFFVTINAPGFPLQVILSDSMNICSGGSDGIAIGEAIGGTPGYVYSWYESGNPQSFSDNDTAFNLSAGSYYLEVTDTNGCDTIASINVLEPQVALHGVVQVFGVQCKGDSTGMLVVDGGGGFGPYDYEWFEISGTPLQSSAMQIDRDTLKNLSAGSYVLHVSDSKDCLVEYVLNVPEPDFALSIDSMKVVNDIACFGGADGRAIAYVSGGQLSYSFEWDNGEDTLVAQELTSGYHVFSLIDAWGCEVLDSIEVSENDLIVSDLVVDTTVSCYGFSDGGVSVVTLSGGSSSVYTYFWSTGQQDNWVSTAFVDSLPYGSYYVTTRDSLGCEVVDSVFISEPEPLSMEAMELDWVDCYNDSTGEGTAMAVGGTAPYQFDWATGTWASSQGDTITTLTKGFHTVVVTDTRGCTASDTIEIHNPDSLYINIIDSLTVLPYCMGVNTASLSAVAFGGTGSYIYEWDDNLILPQTTTIATNLLAGVYTVTVTDDKGCTAFDTRDIDTITNTMDADTVLISQYASTDSIGAVLDSNEVSCFGLNDGAVSVNAWDGHAPYDYQWYGPNSFSSVSSVITNLYAGTYSVTVRDINDCMVNTSVILAEPLALTFNTSTVVDESCLGACDGEIFVDSIAGGVATYSALLTDNVTGVTTPHTIVNDTITGVCSGDYTVVLTDVNDCPSSVIVGGLNQQQVSTSVFTEADIQAIVDTVCYAGLSGELTVNNPNTNTGYTYNWENVNDPGAVIATGTTVSNLGAGTYMLLAGYNNTDGCIDTAIITITSLAMLNVTNYVVTDADCYGASTGEVAVTADPLGVTPYTYSWSTGATTATATTLSAGPHILTLTDSIGCEQDFTYQVSEPPAVNVNVVTSQTYILTANATGGTSPYTYSWRKQPSVTLGSNASYTVSSNGSYYVIVTDANGCEDTSDVILFGTTGLISTDGIALNIYPNPFKDETTVDFGRVIKEATITVIDVYGKLIETHKLESQDTYIIKRNTKASGVYFLEIEMEEEELKIVKIVLEK
jgi:hypothetical protein